MPTYKCPLCLTTLTVLSPLSVQTYKGYCCTNDYCKNMYRTLGRDYDDAFRLGFIIEGFTLSLLQGVFG